jgi:peptidoglycan hydrolase CwlO-like protein
MRTIVRRITKRMISTTLHANAAIVEELEEQRKELRRQQENIENMIAEISARIDKLGGEEYWRKILG